MAQDKLNAFLKNVKTTLLISCLKKYGIGPLGRKEALEKLQSILSNSPDFLKYLDFYSRMGKKQVNKTKFLTLISKLSSAPAENGIEEAKNWQSRLMICYISNLVPEDVETIFWSCRIAEKKKKFVYVLEPPEIELKTQVPLEDFLKKYNESSPLKMIASITPSKTTGSLDTTIRVQKEHSRKTFRHFKDRKNVLQGIDSEQMYPITSKIFHLRLYDRLWHLQSSYDLEVSLSNTNEYRTILLEVLKVMFARNVSLKEETSSRINKFETDVKDKKSIAALKSYFLKIKLKAKQLVNASALDDRTKEKYKNIIDTFGPMILKCKDDEIKLRELLVDGDINELSARNDSSLQKVKEIIKKGGKVSVVYSLNDKKIEFLGGKKRASNLTKDEEEALEFLLNSV